MNNYVGLNEIKKRLIYILVNKFSLDESKLDEEFFSKDLMGMEVGLLPRQMLYLFFGIEEEFGIKIPEEEIIKGSFNCSNNIIEIIKCQLEEKAKVS